MRPRRKWPPCQGPPKAFARIARVLLSIVWLQLLADPLITAKIVAALFSHKIRDRLKKKRWWFLRVHQAARCDSIVESMEMSSEKDSTPTIFRFSRNEGDARKFENFRAAVALHYGYYNFVKYRLAGSNPADEDTTNFPCRGASKAGHCAIKPGHGIFC